MCVWGHTVHVLGSVLAESYRKAEQLSSRELSKDSWDEGFVAPISQGHAIYITGRSKEAGRAAGLAAVPVSVRDGTRLCAISGWESPFMSSPFKLRPWSSPTFVFDCKGKITTVTSPFRALVAGIVHDLEDVEATNCSKAPDFQVGR